MHWLHARTQRIHVRLWRGGRTSRSPYVDEFRRCSGDVVSHWAGFGCRQAQGTAVAGIVACSRRRDARSAHSCRAAARASRPVWLSRITVCARPVAVQTRPELSEEHKVEIREAFELFDTEKSGKLDYHEFKVSRGRRAGVHCVSYPHTTIDG